MEQPSLNIGLGTVMQVEFVIPGLNKEYKGFSSFVGAYDNEYIILSLPKLKKTVEMSDVLQPKRLLRIRYLYEGDIYVFSSMVENVTVGAHSLLFVKFPDSIQIKKLRKYPRSQCSLAARLEFLDEMLDGKVKDISTGGLRFEVTFKGKKADFFAGIKEELTATLNMDDRYKTMEIGITFPGSAEAKMFNVVLRNFEIKKNTVIFGHEFTESDIEKQHIISQYLEAVAI